MGNIKIDRCIFTGLPITQNINGIDRLEYWIKVENVNHFISLDSYAQSWVSDVFFNKNRHLLAGLLINNKWFEDETHEFIKLDSLKKLLSERDYPKTANQKSENLFLNLFKLQDSDGRPVLKQKLLTVPELWTQFYFSSYEEFIFYFNHLEQEGLITIQVEGYIGSDDFQSFTITFEGLNQAIKLQENGDQSNKCFIAMSFEDSTKPIRQAIREALIDTGYEPILIDEKQIPSDKTINDEIIANLKRCKFCIADFTHHKNGVYFESGFALGQGKKVIYTCQEEDFKNAHFDIKPLQHIIYSTPEDLKKALVFKIEAFIS